MEPYLEGWKKIEKTNFGVQWDPHLGANTNSILQYDQYNGRVHLLDDSNPDLRFQMAEKISIKNKATEYRDALTGLHEETVLSRAYFSEENIQILQNGLRAGVYELSNKEWSVPPQNIDNLKIIMRSIYLQYAKHSTTESITDQIRKLNQYVLDYAVPKVYNEAQGYLNYIRDQSTLVMPLERAKQSDRDFKHLEWKRFF
tara:strand:+ start:55 stop:654 length:600 start_codon:yes stop_codon:yes gene_type:complete